MSSVPLLVVDTSVALHVMLPRPHPGQEESWKAAHELLRIDTSEWQLAMATPALAEVLAGIPSEKRSAALRHLQQMFEMLVFDVEAARVGADLAAKGVKGRNPEVSRQRVKVDVEIVACAMRWGAGGLCVLDGDHAGILKRNHVKSLRCGPPSVFSVAQQDLL